LYTSPLAKPKDQDEAEAWIFREVSRVIIIKAEIQAAVESQFVKALLVSWKCIGRS
jgi:hypothetical protein